MPIPKRNLIDTATLKKRTGLDDYQNPIYEETELTFVRIEETDRIVNTSTNQERRLESVLLYDLRNSRPLNVEFTTQDFIIYDNIEYSILKIATGKNGFRKHHLEIGLV